MTKPILIQSLKALKHKSNKSVGWFYAALGVMYLLTAGVGFVGPIQSMMMKKFHLGTLPFGLWTVCQFFPSMYNFKNEILISSRQLPMDFAETDLSGTINYSVNHYPMRIAYFSNVRESLYGYFPVYVYLRSVYRGREIVSSYRIDKTPRGASPVLLNLHERTQR